jgi:hypothetical protein
MAKRIFEVTVTKTIMLELDDAVINAVDDEWRSQLYNLHEPEEIASMIGRCMVLFGSELSSLDGWADQPDSNARILETVDEDVEAQEVSASNTASTRQGRA